MKSQEVIELRNLKILLFLAYSISFAAPCTDYTCDSLVIRQILDDNQHFDITVQEVATQDLDTNRVVAFRTKYKSFVSIPPIIGDLSALRELDLDRANITKIPSEIGQLKELIFVNLSYSNLDTLPIEFWNLSKLYWLALNSNKFRTLPPEINKLDRLTKLYMASNPITYLPSEFGELKSIQVIDFQRNGLSILPKEFWNLNSLQYLQLNNNRFDSLPADIGKLKNLTGLVLFENKLIDIPIEIQELSKLNYLNLRSNNLKSLSFSITNFDSLEFLFLKSNELDTIPDDFFLPNHLKAFTLADNRFCNISEELYNNLRANVTDVWLTSQTQDGSKPCTVYTNVNLRLSPKKSLNMVKTAKGQLQMSIMGISKGILKVFDLNGKMKMDISVDANYKVVDAPNLKAGVYTVLIYEGNTKFVKHLYIK